ncbi:hypothetical protein TNIN_466581 [Trichonephila inaurata madagascariensis]|uniref:Uncharacterized protein n=1 Tax=Trichonephila inaurata madagascariensis TaxID=2747483 RepID=A0A8X6JQD1_9ARAC|nr:hypothetical protein TNIN_466581 [Trichonephila inaurata madagascariensis]
MAEISPEPGLCIDQLGSDQDLTILKILESEANLDGTPLVVQSFIWRSISLFYRWNLLLHCSTTNSREAANISWISKLLAFTKVTSNLVNKRYDSCV